MYRNTLPAIRLREPAYREYRLHALDKRVGIALLETGASFESAGHAHRLRERFGVEEDALVMLEFRGQTPIEQPFGFSRETEQLASHCKTREFKQIRVGLVE